MLTRPAFLASMPTATRLVSWVWVVAELADLAVDALHFALDLPTLALRLALLGEQRAQIVADLLGQPRELARGIRGEEGGFFELGGRLGLERLEEGDLAVDAPHDVALPVAPVGEVLALLPQLAQALVCGPRCRAAGGCRCR